MANQDYDLFIEWLTNKHGKILEAETVALETLKVGDAEEYKKKMREKAIAISELYEESKPMIEKLPAEKRAAIAKEMERFSTSAAAALSLDSVFYMSALLYRDEHKEGEPDNLLAFIEKLKAEKN